MTSNYHYEIDRIIKANKLHRFESEIKESTDETRTTILNNLLKQYQDHRDNKQIKEDTLQSHFNMLKMSQFQKKWQFLNPEQRLDRFDEFVKRENIIDMNLIDPIRGSIENGTLQTKHVTYNVLKCYIEKITAPSMQQFNEEKTQKLNTNNNQNDCKDENEDDENETDNEDEAEAENDNSNLKKNNFAKEATKNDIDLSKRYKSTKNSKSSTRKSK
jgi:hypothetical protein